MRKSFLFSLVSACTFISMLRAQEVQVPIDSLGKIETIDAELERKLGLFTTYQNFREARLYQLPDNSFVLEVLYQPADRVQRMRLPMTVAETAEFRSKVSQRINEQAPQATMNQDGRTRMIIGSAVLSLGFWGWTVPSALDVQDGKTAFALYLLTGGGGFFVPLAATTNRPVTDAHATLYLYGGTRGIIHGIYLYNLFAGGETTGRGTVSFALLGSVAEAVAGFAVAEGSGMQPGKASVICVGGDFGMGNALGVCDLADFFDSGNERAAAVTVLLGSGAGLIAGNLLANSQHYTRGDALVLEGSGFLGTYVSLAALDLFDAKTGKGYTAAVMAGSIAGLALADGFFVRGKDFSASQGFLIELGELGGALVGAGIAYLVSPDVSDGTLFLSSSALGAVGGYALTYSLFSRDAQTRENSSSWNINLFPTGLMASVVKKSYPGSLSPRIPFLQIQYQF